MSQGLDGCEAKLIGVDNSAAMIEQANTNLAGSNAELIERDVMDTKLTNAGMVLMNFTLQFIPVELRDELLRRIYIGLVDGGVLVLSEKIRFDDEATNQTLTNIHHQYKADQGYSEMEIAKKRDAIVNVLIPETLDSHLTRLHQAGFKVATPWVQNLQFISILAIK